MFFYILGFVSIAFVLCVVFLVKRYENRRHLLKSLNLRLLLVKLPIANASDKNQKEGGFKDEINLTAQLFSALAATSDPVVFEVAVPNVGEEISFYVTVTRGREEFAMRQIQGLWKDAHVDLVSDFNVFHPEGVVGAVYVKQKSSYALPIRTYLEANLDTFSTILSNLSQIQIAGEGVALQVILQPAPTSARKNILRIKNNLIKGGGLEDVLGPQNFFGFIERALVPKKKESPENRKPVDAELVKALEAKVSKSLFNVNLRLVVSAPSKMRSDELLEGLIKSFDQFSAPQRNEFKILKPRTIDELITQFSFREMDGDQSMILNSEEVASLFHFPISTTAVPHISFQKAKEAAPPENLPTSGTLIGESVFRGRHVPVYITDEDRRRHVYIIGQTGTGKTTSILHMAVNDIKNGKGVAVIDPHGDLVHSILKQIPQNRANDVIIFDPGDLERPVGLNMLEYDPTHPEEKTFIVNEMQGIFNKLFLAETMGPIFEQYMRNALLLLMDNPNDGATLMEVPRVFTDPAFRKSKLEKATNPAVIDFWEKEASKATGEHSLANMAPYITSKFNNFIANDYVRPIIGQFKSSFNFRNVMDEGKIVLINLSKGRIGDINAGLLGMIITGKFLMAALSRTDIPEAKRRDFNLYIDEFQNFTTDSISTILSEARKYHLNLVMAHQFIGQLTEKIRDAVFGNVGSIIAFRIGPADAEMLLKQFEQVFSINDLVNIDNFNAYVKLLIRGTTTRPFNIRITAPVPGSEDEAQRIKDTSRMQYGRDRSEVETSILARLRGSGLDPKKAKENLKSIDELL